MYEVGYDIDPDLVDPDFARSLLRELKANKLYDEGSARQGREPGVVHRDDILSCLDSTPLLRGYLSSLNEEIVDITGQGGHHLTYLQQESVQLVRCLAEFTEMTLGPDPG